MSLVDQCLERDFLTEVGRRVRELRDHRGLTQTTLAALVDIPVSAVSVIERGERPTDIVRLRRIAAVLGVPPGRLLLDDG